MFQSNQLFCLQDSRQGCITWRGLAWALGRKRRGQRRGLRTSCHLPCREWDAYGGGTYTLFVDPTCRVSAPTTLSLSQLLEPSLR